MRAPLAALALIALTAGCGSTASPSKRSAPTPGSLESLWRNSGESVSLIPGTSDYSPGKLRDLLPGRRPAGTCDRASACASLGRSLAAAKPFAETVAQLEPIGIPGVSTGADAKAIYVAHVRVPEPGTYYVLARPVGPVRIGGLRELLVRSRTASPPVGSRAYPSRTPTLASNGGDVSALTTRVPPDRALLRTSIAAALRAHEPFVVTFATPRYCVSRTCGPVVDVVDHVRKRYATLGGPLHPRRDLRRQQPEQRTESLGARMALAG